MQNRLKKAGPGRPKGTPNRTTVILKDALILAAQGAGGKDGLVGYLKTQAIENPGPFMQLLGKVLPLQVTGADGGPVLIVTGVQRLVDEVEERAFTHPNSHKVLELRRRDENR